MDTGDTVDASKIANKLFAEEISTAKPSEITQFLAGDDPESTEIRTIYFNNFQWPANLLSSMRLLCSKLYLKAESQELDRILSSFAQSYLQQHPQNVFCTQNFEQIYVIVYSLILLNTALHNSELNKKSRIRQSDFIRNTLSTFLSQDAKLMKSLSTKQKLSIEVTLSDYYDDLVKNELILKTETSTPLNRLSRASKDEDNSTNITTTTLTTSTDGNADLDHNLTRKSSNSSIWSTDTSQQHNQHHSQHQHQRFTNGLKRITTATSTVTAQTTQTTSTAAPARVGLARALAGSVVLHEQSMYKHSNHSLMSQRSSPALRHRTSFDQTNKRTSVISRKVDDTMSVLSLDIAGPNWEEDQKDMEQFDVDDYQDEYDLELELNGSPYLKEGLLKLKILNNDSVDDGSITQQPQGNRFFSFFHHSKNINALSKFVDHFVVVSKGELSLYSFDPKVIKKHKRETEVEDDIGDGNWLRNAVKLGTYNLCSTFACLDKSQAGKVYWTLTFPQVTKKPAKKFIFEAGTKEIALEFVNTCNFWAAKISAIPTLEESVSSEEYGWVNLNHLIKTKKSFKKLKNIQKWEPVLQGVYISNLSVNEEANHWGMMNQFVKTSSYYNHLKKSYRDFTHLKQKFIENFPKAQYNGSNYTRVINNFDAKIEHYKHQLMVYRSYIIILGFALQLRFDLHEEKKLQARDKLDASLEDDSSHHSLIDKVEQEDDELTKLVKSEIKKLFFNMKDIGNIIPTFKSSKSIKNIAKLQEQHQLEQNKLVKSPKTFTLSNLKDNESPIAQLIATSNQSSSPPRKESVMETTITEEDEEEDEEEGKKTGVEQMQEQQVGGKEAAIASNDVAVTEIASNGKVPSDVIDDEEEDTANEIKAQLSRRDSENTKVEQQSNVSGEEQQQQQQQQQHDGDYNGDATGGSPVSSIKKPNLEIATNEVSALVI
ncbi:Sec7 domain family protein [Candida parapsilosis]|uniref:SEC7 domain-containing protein n=2 Tax=Candida parapsilosis TaxID=5480 RepID=G8BKX2_CANPC|nr:uncharacterized protein CPAR2_704020 [Candida parapsilosis]KAF6042033.1 Sec7 domain family protein [Candida parapsilosis]KAF6042312.1 Sec7 domain family protein [Candida parapsilosis]KAF6042757.1 Sec7 domain family protein [Candida parapsilosis]KAF6058234.1 Sec7 domain family protein [Candida parapsilosis]KAI5904156.1 Guanine-nucleotide exchange factor YEL1 [Candida parapsilosis]